MRCPPATWFAAGCGSLLFCGCNFVLGITDLSNDGASPVGGGALGGDTAAGAGGAGGAGGVGGAGGAPEGGASCEFSPPDVAWASRVGSPGNADSVTDVAIDPTGVSVLVGELEEAGELELPDGSTSVVQSGTYVVAYTSEGATLPGFPLPLPGSQPRVAIRGSKLFVAASFIEDIVLNGQPHDGPGAYIQILQQDGSFGATQVLLGSATSQIVINGLATTPAEEGVVAVGQFSGSVDFEQIGVRVSEPGSNADIFVLKYALSGSWFESHSGGNGSMASANAVALTTTGDIVVTGRRQGPTRFGSSTPVAASAGLYVARLAPGGDELADGTALFFPENGGGVGRSLSRTSDGGVMVGASTQADQVELDTIPGNISVDADTPFVIALNAQNQARYVAAIEGASAEEIAVAVSGDRVAVTGYYSGEAGLPSSCKLAEPAADDIFAILLDNADGSLFWQQRFGASLNDRGVAVDANATGLVFAGTFSGAVSFGQQTLDATGGTDAFIARVTPAR